MSQRLYAVGDIGATNLRVGIYNDNGEFLIGQQTGTNPNDYEGAVQTVADMVQTLHPDRGEVVAASVAVAATVDDNGVLVKSGQLSPWLGKKLSQDLAQALDFPEERVGAHNDMVAVALSQQHVNQLNGRPVEGVASTLSTGWGGALYWAEGKTKGDEPGHEYLRDGGTCTCGGEGHAEAFVSGGGVRINQGVSMEEWLGSLGSQRQLVEDLSAATIAMIERLEGDNDFEAQEMRWTGGIALAHPFIISRVAPEVQAHFREAQNGRSIAFDTVTMGEQAGLHGTLIDAQARAQLY